MTMTDQELYEGFTEEQVERYRREVRERFDPDLVRESERRVRNMSKAEWNAVEEEGEDVTRLIAALIDRMPGDEEVQELIARHHATIERFYPASAEVYRGLGRLYAEHGDFRKHFDKYRRGLAHFMAAAMAYYADYTLIAE